MVLLYDDDCALCRWAVVWVLDRDHGGLIKALGIETTRGGELLEGLDHTQRLSSIHVITGDGARLSGGSALIALLQALPGRNLARLAAASPRITAAAYRLVARHRGAFSRLISQSAKRRADHVLRVYKDREGFVPPERP